MLFRSESTRFVIHFAHLLSSIKSFLVIGIDSIITSSCFSFEGLLPFKTLVMILSNSFGIISELSESVSSLSSSHTPSFVLLRCLFLITDSAFVLFDIISCLFIFFSSFLHFDSVISKVVHHSENCRCLHCVSRDFLLVVKKLLDI